MQQRSSGAQRWSRALAGGVAAASIGLAPGATAEPETTAPDAKPDAGASAEAGAPLPEPEQPATPDTWYAQALAHSPIGINVTHFWSKGRLLRTETVIAGRPIVTIVTKDTYFAYDQLVRTGLAIQRAPLAVRQDSERSRPFGNEVASLRRQGAEKVREEQLGGRDVELYQVTDSQGRRRVWVSRDELRLPVRLEVYRRATGGNFLTDFINWQRAIPIADAFFLPHPGIEFSWLSYEEYVAKQAAREPIGPVPVLYTDMLHGY
jgi:hypothetical protein